MVCSCTKYGEIGELLMNRKISVLILIAVFLSMAFYAEASSLSSIFSKVKSSVVMVRTVQTDISPVARGNFVSSFSLGSGVIISKDGLVMTAAHVIQTVDAVCIETLDHELIPAKIIASVPFADVALLRLDKMPENTVVAKIGDSDRMVIGDDVFVVGAPYGLSQTLTSGIISARHMSNHIMGDFSEVELFQTDAAINRGNSGAPVFNMNGEVIGIVSHIMSLSGGSNGLGFAVTSNVAKKLLIDQESYWSGVEGVLISDDVAKLFNVPQPEGFMIQRVADNSPASRMGIKGGTIRIEIEGQQIVAGGDILLEVAGISITRENIEHDRIRKILNNLAPGETATVKLLRGGTVLALVFRKTE